MQIGRRHRKITCIILTGPKDRRHAMSCRTTREFTNMVWRQRQKEEALRPWGLLGCPWERQGKAGGSSSGWAGLKTFCRLWAIGVVPCCLVPSPGMIKTEEYCLQGCLSQTEEVWLWKSKTCTQAEPLLALKISSLSPTRKVF